MKTETAADKEQIQRDFGFGLEIDDYSYFRETFSTFYKKGTRQPNSIGATEELSNLIEHWIDIPKYCVAPKTQTAMRTEQGTLETVTKRFMLNGVEASMIMRPARIEDPKTKKELEYFPTQNDEVIERILLKLFTEDTKGAYPETTVNRGEGIVRFRLRDIGRILKANGITRNRADIKRSLYVMAGTSYTIQTRGGKPITDRIISSLIDGSENNYWTVRFSMLVSSAIAASAYRQFPFTSYVQLRNNVGKWLLTRMSMQKNIGDRFPHEVRVSEGVEHGVLNNANIHDNIKYMRKAIEVMSERGLIDRNIDSDVIERPIKKHGKVVDMIFKIPCNDYMLGHAKAANARQRDNQVLKREVPELALMSR